MLTLLAQLNRLHTCSSIMAEHLDPNDLVTIEELGISNMGEMASSSRVTRSLGARGFSHDLSYDASSTRRASLEIVQAVLPNGKNGRINNATKYHGRLATTLSAALPLNSFNFFWIAGAMTFSSVISGE